jgi:hypothetical protein
MNSKEKLFYILNELSNSIDSGQHFETVTQQTKLQNLLFTIFEYLVRESDKVKEDIFKIFEQYPIIYADIVSASDNPNCSCRGRVFSYFREHYNDVKNIFENYLKNNLEITEDFYNFVLDLYLERSKKNENTTIQPQNTETKTEEVVENNKNLIGKVIIINNDQEYSSLIKLLYDKKYEYKGINIVEKHGQTKLYIY